MNGTSIWASLGLAAISSGLGGCAAPNSIGRYQQLGENRVIDTATGSVWQYDQTSIDQSGNQELGWRSLGNPARQTSIPVQQTVAPSSVNQPTDAFPQADDAKQLDQNLAAVKAAKDEGTLSDEEYGRTRAAAFSTLYSAIKVRQISAQNVYDELGYLSKMNKEHRLSDKEYQEVKAAILEHFLPNGQ